MCAVYTTQAILVKTNYFVIASKTIRLSKFLLFESTVLLVPVIKPWKYAVRARKLGIGRQHYSNIFVYVLDVVTKQIVLLITC